MHTHTLAHTHTHTHTHTHIHTHIQTQRRSSIHLDKSLIFKSTKIRYSVVTLGSRHRTAKRRLASRPHTIHSPVASTTHYTTTHCPLSHKYGDCLIASSTLSQRQYQVPPSGMPTSIIRIIDVGFQCPKEWTNCSVSVRILCTCTYQAHARVPSKSRTWNSSHPADYSSTQTMSSRCGMAMLPCVPSWVACACIP